MKDDLTGMKFGRLTVIERAENKNACWRCKCDCGNEVVVNGDNLRSQHTLSCGCLQKERTTTHDLTHTKIYSTWDGIKQRCLNPNHQAYKHYGGRGITICAEWRDDFQSFYEYVSKLEHFNEDGYSLDRINNNGNYEPGNIRWADLKTQHRNYRQNVLVEYQGQTVTLVEASELSGISYNVLCLRYHRGDRDERLFRSVRKSDEYERV